jgi:hypothetical protein
MSGNRTDSGRRTHDHSCTQIRATVPSSTVCSWAGICVVCGAFVAFIRVGRGLADTRSLAPMLFAIGAAVAQMAHGDSPPSNECETCNPASDHLRVRYVDQINRQMGRHSGIAARDRHCHSRRSQAAFGAASLKLSRSFFPVWLVRRSWHRWFFISLPEGQNLAPLQLACTRRGSHPDGEWRSR